MFFDINIKILKVSGLWVPDTNVSTRKRVLALIYNSASVFYSMIYFTIAELVALKESSKNINDLVKNLNMSMSFILTLCKISVWFYNRKEIVGIMNTLEVSSKQFEPVKDFNPTQDIIEEKKVKDRLTYTFFVIAFTVPTSACLMTFYSVFNDHDSTEDGYNRKLPYHSFVPFNYNASKFTYCVAVVYQCFALLSCGTMTVGFDMLYSSLISFTSAHLKILQGAFKTIRDSALKKYKLENGRKSLNVYMEDEMAKCIKHLQLILEICDTFERIFTYLILFQILVSLLVFCTCLYLVSSIPMGSKIFGNEIAYMMAIENQLALYCAAGNKLTVQAEGIPFAVYESDWFTASKKFKQNMIFTMMRMNKMLHLTAGKFTALSLPTFVSIGRGSYSLLAVLKK